MGNEERFMVCNVYVVIKNYLSATMCTMCECTMRKKKLRAKGD